MVTTASTFSPMARRAASMQRGSIVLLSAKRPRPSLPVTREGVPAGTAAAGEGLADGREEVALVGQDELQAIGVALERHHLQARGAYVYSETVHRHLVDGAY